uniref:AC4 n=1 Tax=Caenorhabditis tropicalis TaxID=1561998 RepID=A0A1I7U1W4_9PELO
MLTGRRMQQGMGTSHDTSIIRVNRIPNRTHTECMLYQGKTSTITQETSSKLSRKLRISMLHTITLIIVTNWL